MHQRSITTAVANRGSWQRNMRVETHLRSTPFAPGATPRASSPQIQLLPGHQLSRIVCSRDWSLLRSVASAPSLICASSSLSVSPGAARFSAGLALLARARPLQGDSSLLLPSKHPPLSLSRSPRGVRPSGSCRASLWALAACSSLASSFSVSPGAGRRSAVDASRGRRGAGFSVAGVLRPLPQVSRQASVFACDASAGSRIEIGRAHV